MKFETKLWRRSNKSYAATIPQVLCSFLDLEKKYDVEWTYTKGKWSVELVEHGKRKKGVRIYTKLWKRSQRSYATTVPHAVLLQINEEKKHLMEWNYEENKWQVEAKEVDA